MANSTHWCMTANHLVQVHFFAFIFYYWGFDLLVENYFSTFTREMAYFYKKKIQSLCSLVSTKQTVKRSNYKAGWSIKTLCNEVIAINVSLRQLVNITLRVFWQVWMQNGIAAEARQEVCLRKRWRRTRGAHHTGRCRTHCQEKLCWQRHSTLTNWNMRWLPTRAA